MPETHALVHGVAVDDQFFRRYRALLDAEDCAFDELEHAYEDGDRTAFDCDLAAWQVAASHRRSFLEMNGLTASPMLL